MVQTRPGYYTINWFNGVWEAKLDADLTRTYTKVPSTCKEYLGEKSKSRGLGEEWKFVRSLVEDDFETTGVE